MPLVRMAAIVLAVIRARKEERDDSEEYRLA